MRAVPILLLLVPVASQEVVRTRDYHLTLPPGWRRLLPEEAHRLRHAEQPVVPAALAPALPARMLPFGPIEDWLAGRFDGAALEILELENEVELDEAGIARIRRAWEHPEGGGAGATIRSIAVTELGADRNGAIVAVVDHPQDAAGPPRTSLHCYVPTAGQTLVLAYRAAPERFASAEAGFRASAATLVVARPKRGPDRLSDNLLYAAGVGALVALLFGVLYRRSPPPG
jgi:hypothetical protein